MGTLGTMAMCSVHCLQIYHAPSSVWSKTTLISGNVGGAGAGQPTCKLVKFFIISLRRTEPIFNNFQENGASGKAH